MSRKHFLIFFLILFLGVFIRFNRLGEVPAGFHRDEAFLGYNAYSILKTGRDINGNFLPLHLESFLYSPSGYSYLSIPFIKLFGLNAFSVRFASAFFGSLTIILTFILTKSLFYGYKYKVSLGLLSSFLLAISPWHINLSRTATENVIAVFFISLGVLIYIQWLKTERWYLLVFSFLSFGITFLIYQAPRVFLPFFIPSMAFFVRKNLNATKIKYLTLLFFTIIIVPLFIILFSKELSLRIRTVSIFSTNQTQLVIDEQIRGDGVSNVSRFIAKSMHNKPLAYASQFLQNYFKHFSYEFLFTDSGFPDRYRVPLAGILYIFELPLLVAGIWFLFQSNKKIGTFLIFWVFLAPIGSALTFDDVPNLQRTLVVFPALSIISAFGLLNIILLIKKNKKILILSIAIVFSVITYSFLFYLHQYYIHMNMYRPWYRQDGYKELVEKVNNFLPGYKKAVITNYESAPTIFFLFYNKYNPTLFQKQTNGSKLRDFDRIDFGNYEFSQEQCPLKIAKNEEKNILYVNSSLCPIPKNARVLFLIKRTDNSAAWQTLTIN